MSLNFLSILVVPNTMKDVFLIFKVNLLFRSQVDTSSKPLESKLSSSVQVLARYATAVSSAYKKQFPVDTVAGRSLMYMTNNRGPSMDPCGTPYTTSSSLLAIPEPQSDASYSGSPKQHGSTTNLQKNIQNPLGIVPALFVFYR